MVWRCRAGLRANHDRSPDRPQSMLSSSAVVVVEVEGEPDAAVGSKGQKTSAGLEVLVNPP